MLRRASLATSLGTLTLTADASGLCGLTLPEESVLYPPPPAVATMADPLLSKAAQQILAYLHGHLRCFDLPLSLHGTPFQLQVWEQLCTIPYGKTRSYSELAAHLGDRRKARAVGGAARANPLALIVPCHRLIGADGSLTGFGGGLPLKQILLELEQENMVEHKHRE
ncbi:methylated-DNA--[protein]-cysteine S-methyltransferase [Desulfobulbus alkaliphilus]|uniref:methylated-DNA--[protein]-cysteine S-methyltransferase n=1 Tax=Desulfobulbus alkaliphilus TaxID=869814 RepID=UPI00196629D0|nr:methylated-DNA--[protein]-cysteine S-methyltransferase [Desulfobulbus alkaliphilus]MBM9536931.1 methylated-DNA--[protein]-cysteine S-methyltransferase [Desulfobulbus alkaliphilus]